MFKRITASIAIVVLFGLIASAIVYNKIKNFGQQLIEIDTAHVIHLKPGQSAHTVYRSLPLVHDKANNLYFKLWLRLYPQNSRVKAGYYVIKQTMSLNDVYAMINRGEQTQFSIALVEGQTIRQWLEVLRNTDTLFNDLPELADLYRIITDNFAAQTPNSVAQANNEVAHFCKNTLASLEGCLLADTYFYSYQDSALSILQRAFIAMDSALDAAWDQRFQDIPLSSPYEALILASIIEKETAVAHERGIIAGVFSNRLELNMRLQTDPTVIYGIGPDFDGNITRAHLREKTLYNTYRINGLPPTPIAMAGKSSLMAAVQPEITDYIYFVAKGDGSHQFSTTLQEHNRAVAKYQLNR